MNDVAAGWRVVSISSNALPASVFAMPAHAVVWDDACISGAGYGAWRLPDGWHFPFNGPAWTNGFLWVEGLFRPRFDDRSNEIRLLDGRFALCPEAHWARYNLAASRAWCMMDEAGGLVATFENAALDDDPSKIVSAQLELKLAQGEVALRYDLRTMGESVHTAGPVVDGVFHSVAVSSNTSEVVFRRVHPDDWDWDGLPDGIDDEPHEPRPTPVWGQSEEWAALAFPSNAAEIAAAGGYLAWATARAAEPNRHLVGLEILSPDNVWPICVTFGAWRVMCNSTNTLYFAIDDGAKYAFELSDGELFAVSIGDEDRLEGHYWESWYNPWTWCVSPTWVSVHMDSARMGWIGRMPDVSVEGLEGAHFYPDGTMQVTAVVTNCHGDAYIGCEWSGGPGMTFSDPHARTTTITWNAIDPTPWATNYIRLVTTYAGDYAVTNNGYTVSVGPQSEPETRFTVSCPSVQFVNDGVGGDRPERVYPVSVELLAARGTRGRVLLACDEATATRIYEGADRNMPVSVVETYEVEIPREGGFMSGLTFYMTSSNCAHGAVHATFQAEGDTSAHIASVPFKVIEPLRKLVTTDEYEGRIVNPSRLVWGTNAVLKVGVGAGSDFAPTDVVWSVVEGPGRIVATNGWYVTVEPTATNGDVVVEARFNNDAIQPRFVLPVVKKRIIPLKVFAVKPPRQYLYDRWIEEEAKRCIAKANQIYMQVGVEFVLREFTQDVEVENCWDIRVAATETDRETGDEYTTLTDEAWNLLNYYDGEDCVEIYLVGNVLDSDVDAIWCGGYGIIVERECDDVTLAHELGHAFNLYDTFWVSQTCTNNVYVHTYMTGFDSPVTRQSFPGEWDWGRETGRGFYGTQDTNQEVFSKLLMHGFSGETRGDVPDGAVNGLQSGETVCTNLQAVSVGAKGMEKDDRKVFSK